MNRRDLLGLAAALGGTAWLSGCASGGSRPSTPGGGQLADAAVPAPDPASEALPSPLAPFALDLTGRLAPSVRNLVWSPWSVAMALAMATDGAAGGTLKEMSAVLRAGDDFDARLADGWRRMAHAQGSPLDAANSVWAQRGLAFQQPFLAKLAGLSATLKVADFTADAAGATREINAWVADHTADKITELIGPGMIDRLTRLVLVNALHFRAAWQTPFAEPGDGPFRTPRGSVSVPFLASGEPLAGWRTGGWASASVPCERREFALVVALPDDPAAKPSSAPPAALGLAEPPARAGFSAALSMPAWKLSYRALLNDPLIAAGMPSAFDDARADFSGMTTEVPLVISFVIHQATIEVQAKGIEASAATAVGMRQAMGPAEPPVPLRLDRPFAYAVVHVATRTPLFVGQVADPTQTQVEA